ncbi:MAG TPA: hypothetical protein VKF38_01230 [Anaerolineaceae bacterium]|nr:hypothetical protein [Anaerolineaceae bacterium]
MKIWLIGLVIILLAAIGSLCNAPLAIQQAVNQVSTTSLPQVETVSAPIIQTVTAPLEETATAQSLQMQVPAEIAQLAEEATMTNEAKAIFFAAKPEIDIDRQSFEQHCMTMVSANNVELGCYTPDNRIYILNISDPRLSEEMVVVAAHEMLHAAYAQYSLSEINTLDAQLEAQVSHIHNADLTEELRAYRITEPGQRDNELHSLLGTEFAPLSSELENHYSQYFSNRAAIVKDAQDFNNVFAQLQASLNVLESQIIQMRNKMRGDLARGNIRAYNALVPQFNNLVKQYNQTVNQYNAISRELVGQENSETSQ